MKLLTLLPTLLAISLAGFATESLADRPKYAETVNQPFHVPAKGGLPRCEGELAACKATSQAFPATGQKTCWESDYVEIPCDGTGQDGDIQAGAELSYTETDLTVIDNNTKLEWMKQDINGGDCASMPGRLDIRCVFTWDEAFAYVNRLNTEPCFANHCDWRVPNIKELHSIVNYENHYPPVAIEFNNACEFGCTVETCSCTALSVYWSSTSYTFNRSDIVWTVIFNNGTVLTEFKSSPRALRPVRGAL